MRLEHCKSNQKLIGYSSDEAVSSSVLKTKSQQKSEQKFRLGGLEACYRSLSLKREFIDGLEGL